MKLQLPKAETSVILIVKIQDSSATDGSGLGSLDQTSSITGGYVKRNGTGVALAVDENVTTEGTYQAPSTVAHVRIGTPANMPTGYYELHFHNDLFTTADYVVIGLGGASNMAPLDIEVQLTDFDLNTNGVNLTQIDGQTTVGNNATLNLKQLNLQNSAGASLIAYGSGGPAMDIQALSGDFDGLSIYGKGGGHAIYGEAESGNGMYLYSATGDSFVVETEGTNKNGFKCIGTGTGSDIDAKEFAAIWDEVLTGATHNVTNSAGKRLRGLTDVIIVDGTSPNTASVNNSIRIELDSNASAVDGTYDPAIIFIANGTGMGQSRQIWEYDGDTKLAYVNRDWKTVPDNTTEYVIIANSGDTHVNEGLATGGGADTITLNALASDEDDFYNGQTVFIAAGVGADQGLRITDYDGGTHVATVSRNWITQPTTGSVYAMLPNTNILYDDVMRGTDSAATLTQLRTALGTSSSDVIEELTAGSPDAEPSIGNAIMLLYMALRNALVTDSDAGEQRIANDAGTVITEASVTDSGTVFTKGKYEAVD